MPYTPFKTNSGGGYIPIRGTREIQGSKSTTQKKTIDDILDGLGYSYQEKATYKAATIERNQSIDPRTFRTSQTNQSSPFSSTKASVGSRVVTLPKFLGGGQYISGDLKLTPRDSGSLETIAGYERDHIIPVSLGGTSDDPNLQYLKTEFKPLDFMRGFMEKKGRQEGKMVVELKAIDDYEKGNISLAEARLRVLNWDNKPPSLIALWGKELVETSKKAVKLYTDRVKDSFKDIPALKYLPESFMETLGEFSGIQEANKARKAKEEPFFQQSKFKQSIQQTKELPGAAIGIAGDFLKSVYGFVASFNPDIAKEAKTEVKIPFSDKTAPTIFKTVEEAQELGLGPIMQVVYTSSRIAGDLLILTGLTKFAGKIPVTRGKVIVLTTKDLIDITRGEEFVKQTPEKLNAFKLFNQELKKEGGGSIISLLKKGELKIKTGKPKTLAEIVGEEYLKVKANEAGFTKVPGEEPIKTTKQVPTVVEPPVGGGVVEPPVGGGVGVGVGVGVVGLEQEAKKYKSVDEFVNKIANDAGVSNKAKIQTIPLNKISGTDYIELDKALASGAKLTPQEANNLIGRLEDLIKSNRQITTPINVGVNPDGTYYLIGGNNRIAQALVNGQKEITAMSNDFKTGSQLTDIWNKANKPKTAIGSLEKKTIEPTEKEMTKEEADSWEDYKSFVDKEIAGTAPVKTLSGFINFIDMNNIDRKNIPFKKMDIAEVVRNDKSYPAIRKSGFYATKDIEAVEVRDVYNQTLAPYHMALKQDGFNIGGKFGVIYNKVWKPTETAIQREKTFVTLATALIQELSKRHKIDTSKKNLEHLSDVMEGKVTATPVEAEFTKELRSILNNLRNQSNVVRELMGKDKIGYVKDYVPHLQKTNLWNELTQNDATITDNFDFVIPNQAKNPFALKRLFDELPKSERNLFILLDRYVTAIGKDLFITPAIENIKAYNGVLKNRGLFKASKYWDEYIRVGLLGKQHKLDSALSIGYKTRKGLQKWNDMVNKAFLTGKVAWNIATQPLSYIMNTPMEAGVKNSITAIYKVFNKGTRKYVRENSDVLRIKSEDFRALAAGEGRSIVNRIYRTKVDKWNDFLTITSSVIEQELTLASFVAGLDRAKDLGYTGDDALEFADLVAARTQSMYNRENRALILDSDIARAIFPFQSYAVEMWNHIKEIGTKSAGAEYYNARQRTGKLFRLMIGVYLANLYAQSITGKKKTGVGTFVPFAGAYIDALIAKATGDDTYEGRQPITVLQVGEDIIKGSKDFISNGDTQKLRKVGLNFGLSLFGAGGGGQINNIIDGLIADMEGEVRDSKGEKLFEVNSLLDKVKAPIFGVWATSGGIEYFDDEPKDTGIPGVPSPPKPPAPPKPPKP